MNRRGSGERIYSARFLLLICRAFSLDVGARGSFPQDRRKEPAKRWKEYPPPTITYKIEWQTGVSSFHRMPARQLPTRGSPSSSAISHHHGIWQDCTV
ncbi:hypothetical protein V8C44DRAFT_324708 [Trichoderma aethiopicum]